MNGPINLAKSQQTSVLPPQFEALCPPPQLLPGEDVDRYQAVQAAIFRDLDPQSAIEWLLAIDIAELTWEMQRYRLLRHRVLSTYRQKAIEMTLRRVDLAGIVPEFQDIAEIYTITNAWIGNWTPLSRAILKPALNRMASISTPSAWRFTSRRTRSSRYLNHS